MRVSIVIPCYNEEAAIGAVVDSIPKDLGEIIVVDNNSKDRSSIVAKEHGARVIPETQQGYGAAIRRGINEATGEIIVVLDADGQYPAHKIKNVISYLENNNLDFVSCSRFPLDDKKSLPFVRRFGNNLFTIFINVLFGTTLLDSQSGMWVFKKKIIDRIRLSSFDMPFSQEIKLRLLKEPKVTFAEYHIPYKERTGDSKLVPLKHGFKNLFFLLRLRLEFWRKNNEEKKRLFFSVAVFAILAFYTLISFQHIRDPFIHVTADVNGQNGLAAENLAKYGFFAMKFGLYGRLLDDPAQAAGAFYTHHPTFFLVPTAILYKLFGVSEITTRLGPLTLMIIALGFFAFSLRKLTGTYLFPLFALAVFCILPGAIFYGQTFELAVFSVPASLVTFSFFVFYSKTELTFYKYCLYLSIIVGGLLGWFYYFFAATVWVYLLFFSEVKKLKSRKELLLTIPVLLIALFAFNLGHFYILNGSNALNLKATFLTRAARVPLPEWSKWIWFLSRKHINEVFIATTVFGAILAILRRKKDEYLKKGLLFVGMAVGIAAVFFQWTMHPFGEIFLWAIVAFYTGYLFSYIVEQYKKIGFIFVACVFIAGFYLTTKKLDFFYNDYRILNELDIELLKDMAPLVRDGDVCIGRDARGVGFAGIAEWYMHKKITESPNCFDSNASVALVFNTQLGHMYVEEQELFKQKGFQFGGCKYYWCVMVKPDNPLVK